MKETKYKGYLCSKDGKVYSAKVKGGRGKLDYNNITEMKYKIDRDGYKTVCVSYVNENGKHVRKYPSVHRLVFETYYDGEIPFGYEVDHINNDKMNNSLDNLQLLTRYENGIKRNKNWVAEKRNKYVVYDYISNTKHLLTTQEIMNKYGISRETVFDMGKSNKRSSCILKSRGIDIKIEKSVEDIERVS